MIDITEKDNNKLVDQYDARMKVALFLADYLAENKDIEGDECVKKVIKIMKDEATEIKKELKERNIQI